MNDTDKMNFESYCSEPYTVDKLKVLKDLIGIIEKESGQSFSKMNVEGLNNFIELELVL